MKSIFCFNPVGVGSLTILTLASLLLMNNLATASDQAVPFMGVSLDAPNQTVPPGGLLQMQVFVTEPNPILKGSQRSSFSSRAAAAPLGAIRDASLFSQNGDVSGVAVPGAGGTVQMFFSSPLTSFGLALDSPVFTITVPVRPTATLGQTVPLTLDPASTWFDPNSQLYPLEVKSGLMTVGGTLSILDVTPSWGTITAGTVITITGKGFLASSTVDVNNAIVASTKFVSSTQIQITLMQDFVIEGQRVRVTNGGGGGERVAYYPYPRAKTMGRSTHNLIAISYPIFSHATWTSAYVDAAVGGTVFTGLALQNLNSSAATITLDLFSSTGTLLKTRRVVVGAQQRISRDLTEYFPGGVVISGTYVHMMSVLPVQMLGLLGDDSSASLQPVEPGLAP